MTIPIISYGHSILRQVCEEIVPDDPDIDVLITDLTDTLDAADGVGLAAPQINIGLNMFIVDTQKVYFRMKAEDRGAYFPGEEGIRDIFINARITEKSSDTSIDTEGCLSIPSIVEEIERNWSIEIEYLNSNFQQQISAFSGLTARAIQHEIDHTIGILFVDHLSPLKKKLLKSKLRKISKGEIFTDYTMKFTG